MLSRKLFWRNIITVEKFYMDFNVPLYCGLMSRNYLRTVAPVHHVWTFCCMHEHVRPTYMYLDSSVVTQTQRIWYTSKLNRSTFNILTFLTHMEFSRKDLLLIAQQFCYFTTEMPRSLIKRTPY